MAPSAIDTVTRPIDQLTGEERHRQLKNSVGDRPLDRFVYGPHPISGAQTDPVPHSSSKFFSEVNTKPSAGQTSTDTNVRESIR